MSAKIPLCMLFCLLMGGTSGWAYDFEADGLCYNVTSAQDRTCEVTFRTTAYGSYAASVVIPASVSSGGGDYRVTSVGPNAFRDCQSLYSVFIPATVTSVGAEAFAGCSQLYKVVMLPATPPAGLAAAFSSLDGRMTYTCSPAYSGMSAVLGKIHFYALLSSWFEVGGVRYVPVSLKEGRCDVFDCNYLPSATSVRSDETVPFQGKNLLVVNVNDFTFYGNDGLKDVSLCHSGSIGDYAFSRCTGLKGVILCGSTSLGKYAFSGCSSLDSCSLGSVMIGVGDYAFQGCTALKRMTVTATQAPICTALAFRDINKKNCTVWVPYASKNIYRPAEGWKTMAYFQVLYIRGMVLHLTFKDGVSLMCLFDEQPVIAFPSPDAVTLKSSGGRYQWTLDNLDYWSFSYDYGTSKVVGIPSPPSCAEGVSIRWTGCCARITGKARTSAGLYTADGKLLRQTTIGLSGEADLSLDDLPTGVYVVRAADCAIKLSIHR